jgi:hypothetical protein
MLSKVRVKAEMSTLNMVPLLAMIVRDMKDSTCKSDNTTEDMIFRSVTQSAYY